MTNNDNQTPPQSFKPPERGSQHYKTMRREITSWQPPEPSRPIGGDEALPVVMPNATTTPASVNESVQTPRFRRLFTFNLNADIEEGELMDDDPQMLLNMAFKSHVTGFKLTLEQSQLILAYMHEILKEAEIEEQAIAAEQAMIALQNTADGGNTSNQGDDTSDNDEASSCT